MDAPPIQYAKTSDGVNIAFWAIGEGPPLVILSNPVATNIQLEWELDSRRIAYERLAERATVIRYDCRGLGLSQRGCLDLSPEAADRDLEAVVQSLGLERFAAYGLATTHLPFIYAAEHPDRVSHLILAAPSLPRRYNRRIAAIRMLADQDWEMFTEIQARLTMGWDSPGAVQAAAWLRGTTDTPSDCLHAMDAMAGFSPEPFLAAIKVPTLILHPASGERESRFARTLAGGISGAHMIGIPGWPFGTAITETAVKAILDFINTAPASPGAPVAPPQVDVSAVRTIVFTDVEASTALNERLGDEGARKVLREHERLTREALGEHGGSEVKAMGDGFMAWFPSATRAIECAIALQGAFAASNETAADPIQVRVGINAGEPIAEGDDLFGASVIATARITAAAQGGQILASDVVRQLLAGKGFTFTARGEHALKGFEEPVRLYEVRWRRLVSTEDVAGTIDAFLREGEEKAASAPELPSGMTAILFADIADSTALTERLGDAAFRAKARELGASLRALVRECAGTPVEGPTLGDGVLAVFASAREAIEAARRCAKAGKDAGLPLHLGLHAGDITREKDPDGRDNVYGGAVNIASRIAGLSAPGEVLVSETVRSLARTSAGVGFEDRGAQSLKGVGEPVRVWAVLEEPQGGREATA